MLIKLANLSGQHGNLGVVCFFKAEIHEVCGPLLQSSTVGEVDQTAVTYNKKYVCFF